MTLPTPPRRRADLILVERGLFESRAKAQAAIAAGFVRAAGELVRRASDTLPENVAIEAEPAHPWVSRGGVKLAHALDTFAIPVEGLHALDVGASTGGFSEVLLTRGAAHVTAVDVGRGQLHPKVAADPRITSREGTDIRALAASDLPAPPAIVTIDVSFAPLSAVLGPALALASPDATLIALVKPQFEVGRKEIGKGGIVKDEAARLRALESAISLVQELGLTILGHTPSPIAGGDGNVEYLLVAKRDPSRRRSTTGANAISPPPCGEGSGVGVVPEKATKMTPLYADLQRPILNHPHPHPPHKGEGAENSRAPQHG